MPLVIGVTKEFTPGERRVALVPDVAKKYQGLGAALLLQAGAGASAYYRDEDFGAAELLADAGAVLAKADVVLQVQPLSLEDIAMLKPGCVLVGLQQPWSSAERVKLLIEKKITCFALELLPRISRAQSMDVLSSQAAVSGYECALIAADHSPKFFPMLTYAAGTIRPAKVLVIGAGVAGLQAIATAKRLGAMVSGYDVRPETKEQIESLGAKFVDTGVSAAGAGGYARELTDEEKRQQADKLGKAIADCDALITTAAIPGKRAPQIVSAEMVARMKPGSIVVDMAAEKAEKAKQAYKDSGLKGAVDLGIEGTKSVFEKTKEYVGDQVNHDAAVMRAAADVERYTMTPQEFALLTEAPPPDLPPDQQGAWTDEMFGKRQAHLFEKMLSLEEQGVRVEEAGLERAEKGLVSTRLLLRAG